MSIRANRIEGFTEEFNVPIADFNAQRDDSPVNESPPTLGELLDENIKKLKEKGESLKEKIETAQEKVDDFVRKVTDKFTEITDFIGAGINKLKGMIDDLFSAFPKELTDLFKGFGTFCQGKAMQGNSPRGKKSAQNCAGFSAGNTACPPEKVKGFGTLGDLIGGALGKLIGAVDKLIGALASLLSAGFSANLCNVISSVMGKLGISNDSILGAALGSALTKEGLRGSITGIVDTAKYGFKGMKRYAPKAIKLTTKNLMVPAAIGLGAATVKHQSHTTKESLDAVDPNWAQNEKGETSLAGVGTGNETMCRYSEYRNRSTDFDKNSLNGLQAASPDGDRSFNTAYSTDFHKGQSGVGLKPRYQSQQLQTF